MENFVNREIFQAYHQYLNEEEHVLEKIRDVVRVIENSAQLAFVSLQAVHTKANTTSDACVEARKHFESCAVGYSNLATLVPKGQYYRFADKWSHITQKLVSLIALTIYLEAGFLVSRETVAEILAVSTSPNGFYLDIEDFLLGLLMLASELARLATNSVTLGDYDRPMQISRFICDLNSGFRMLNLKNDSLRKRYDALKYDVKKVEEIVYDISIRGLRN